MELRFRTISKENLAVYKKESGDEFGVLLEVEPGAKYFVFRADRLDWQEVINPIPPRLYVPMMDVGDRTDLPPYPDGFKTAEIWTCGNMVGVLLTGEL